MGDGGAEELRDGGMKVGSLLADDGVGHGGITGGPGAGRHQDGKAGRIGPETARFVFEEMQPEVSGSGIDPRDFDARLMEDVGGESFSVAESAAGYARGVEDADGQSGDGIVRGGRGAGGCEDGDRNSRLHERIVEFACANFDAVAVICGSRASCISIAKFAIGGAIFS